MIDTKHCKRYITVVPLLLAAGCATQRVGAPAPAEPDGPDRPAPRQTTPPPARIPGAAAEPAPRTPAQASGPAVLSLMGKAETLARAGHLDMASATLERALDIEPRNAFVYQRLASVRLAQGQVDQSIALAQKSNNVAGDNPFVLSGNWRLIAEAHRTAGDTQAAETAGAKAGRYHQASVRRRQ